MTAPAPPASTPASGAASTPASTSVPGDLAGQRILVVEDDMMIAVLIEEALQELGCVVVGPVGKLDAALHLAGSEALDAAVLDVNIRGGHVYPVAEQLRSRGIPFALASGYGDWALPSAFRHQPRLTKPFTRNELEAQVRLLCAGLELEPGLGPRPADGAGPPA